MNLVRLGSLILFLGIASPKLTLIPKLPRLPITGIIGGILGRNHNEDKPKGGLITKISTGVAQAIANRVIGGGKKKGSGNIFKPKEKAQPETPKDFEDDLL